MTQTSTAADPTAAEIKAARAALAPVPTIAALDMLHAQGWMPSTAELAAIRAQADFFEWVGMTRTVHLKVVDVYTGAKIGEIIYNTMAPATR